MANALLYYLIVINILTFAVYGDARRPSKAAGAYRSNLADACSHRRHYRSFAWNASMAPQDEAQEVSHTCMHLLCLAGEASFVFNEHCYHIVKNDLVVIPMPDHISNLAAYIV